MPRLAPIGTLLLSATAFAAEPPTLAIVGIHQADLDASSQEDAIDQLIEAVEKGGRLDALSRQEAALAIAGRESVILEEGLLAEGRRFLSDGRTYYNNAEPESAIAVLQQAVDTLSRSAGATRTTRDLWEAHLYMGNSRLALEEPDEPGARDAFASAAALDPEREPNPALFPPDVVGLYQDTRDGLRALDRPVRITAAGSSGTVWVDGQEQGTTPLDVNLLPGTHYITILGDNQQASEAVVVEASTDVLVVELEPTAPTLGDPAATSSGRSQQTGGIYQALARHAEGVDYVLLAGTEDTTLHLQLYASRVESFSRSMDIPFSGTAEDEAVQSVPLLLNFIDDAGQLPSANTTPLASSLDLGTNEHLANMLLYPAPPAPIIDGGRGKGGNAVLIGGGIGLLTAGLVGGIYGITQIGGAPEPVRNGQVVIGPF